MFQGCSNMRNLHSISTKSETQIRALNHATQQTLEIIFLALSNIGSPMSDGSDLLRSYFKGVCPLRWDCSIREPLTRRQHKSTWNPQPRSEKRQSEPYVRFVKPSDPSGTS